MSAKDKPSIVSPATLLRSIADAIDNGTCEDEDCTVVIGNEVFHAGGDTLEEVARRTIWNLTRGIHKLNYLVDKEFN